MPARAEVEFLEFQRRGQPHGYDFRPAPFVPALTPTRACDKVYPTWVAHCTSKLMAIPEFMVAWITRQERKWKWPIWGECYPKREADDALFPDMVPEDLYFDCEDRFWPQMKDLGGRMPETEVLRAGAFRLKCELDTEPVRESFGEPVMTYHARWGPFGRLMARVRCFCRSTDEAPQLVRAREYDCVDGVAESSQTAIARATINGKTLSVGSLEIHQVGTPGVKRSSKRHKQARLDSDVIVIKQVEQGRIQACAYNNFAQDLTIFLGVAMAIAGSDPKKT